MMRIDRRDMMAGALAGIGAGMGALLAGLPAMAAPTPWVKPPRLRAGDTVGLIEPAGFTDDNFDLDLVKDTITAMGLKSKAAPHLAGRYGYLAGTDKDRAADVNAMFADPEVRAVFAVRGGWGCARILPLLDFATIRKNPKLLVGFSDITALHLAFAAKAGFTTIHGPNAASSWGQYSAPMRWRRSRYTDEPARCAGMDQPDARPYRPACAAFGGDPRRQRQAAL